MANIPLCPAEWERQRRFQLLASYRCVLFPLKGCVYCESEEKGNICLPYEEDSPSPGFCDTSEAKEEEGEQLTGPRKEAQT